MTHQNDATKEIICNYLKEICYETCCDIETYKYEKQIHPSEFSNQTMAYHLFIPNSLNTLSESTVLVKNLGMSFPRALMCESSAAKIARISFNFKVDSAIMSLVDE